MRIKCCSTADSPAKGMKVVDHSSSALWQHPLRAVESREASTPSPQPSASSLILFVSVYQDWSGEASLNPLSMPPLLKNISWTISMRPPPGQLLLLTNYRLSNPVIHRGFCSSRNRQFPGDGSLAKGKPQLCGSSSWRKMLSVGTQNSLLWFMNYVFWMSSE